MRELVAIDLPGGAGFVDALRAAWDTGDAVCVLDPRLPRAAVDEWLAALRPSRIVSSDGSMARMPGGGEPVEEGDALVVATSGTTGRARGVILTHDAVRASATATVGRVGGSHWLACLPLTHIGGLSVVTRALLTGAELTVWPGFEAAAHEATHVSLVWTMLGRIDPSVFECILVGGGPAGEVPANVVTTYGMTETGSGVVYDGVPLDGVEVHVGPAGEVLVRGPMLLRGYRDGPVRLESGPDGRGGWFATGDVGRFDDRGRLVVQGRSADVIVTGGEKVWPDAVERVLGQVSSVAECAVWKRADPEWGERVVVWVVPAVEGTPPVLDALVDEVRAVLASWCAPKEMVLVDALPRTSSGKLRRRALV